MKDHVLGLGFHGEGPTDHRFLPPLLERLTADVLLSEGRYPVRIDPPVGLLREPGTPREQGLVDALEDARGAVDIVFLHADGNGDPDAAREKILKPLIDAIDEAFDGGGPMCVPVVPVREMEAWMIADAATLAQVVGSTLDAEALNLPEKAKDVEKVEDPKAVLEAAMKRARSRTRRRSSRVPYEPIAERIRLGCLRSVTSFTRLEQDLRACLAQRWMLQRDGA